MIEWMIGLGNEILPYFLQAARENNTWGVGDIWNWCLGLKVMATIVGPGVLWVGEKSPAGTYNIQPVKKTDAE